MELIEYIQSFFLFLLPGIIGFFIYSTLSAYKEQHYSLEFIKIICLSFSSFLCTDLLFKFAKFVIPTLPYTAINIIHQLGNKETDIPPSNVIVSVFFAILLAYFMVYFVHNNLHFRIANKLKLTNRVDNQPVWDHFFDENNIVVLRDQVTNNTYHGKVVKNSDNSEIRELYLCNVNVFNEESELLYYIDKVYISRKHDDFIIEIHKDSMITEEINNEKNN